MIHIVHNWIAEVSAKTSLSPRFIGALLAYYHGTTLYDQWPSNNNPLEIGGDGDDPWFKLATDHTQGICDYETWQIGAEASVALLNNPPESFSLDMEQIKASNSNPHVQAILMASSGFDAKHFGATVNHPGGLLWSAYLDPSFREYWISLDEPLPHEKPATETKENATSKTITVITASGNETGIQIAQDYKVSLRDLAKANPKLTFDNTVIKKGTSITIPENEEKSILYKCMYGEDINAILQSFHASRVAFDYLNPHFTKCEPGMTIRIPQ